MPPWAEAVAESLGLELLRWQIKSTTKATEGLYSYDVVRRLNDARFDDGDVKDLKAYIKLGVLGRAFRAGVGASLLPFQANGHDERSDGGVWNT